MSEAQAIPTWLTKYVATQNASQLWLQDLQKKIADDFLQRGIPSRREEEWKYTDVSFLKTASYTQSTYVESHAYSAIAARQGLKNTESIFLVLVNGHFVEALSEIALLPDGVTLCSMKQAFHLHAELVQSHLSNNLNLQKHPFASLNAAMLSNGVFLHVPKGVVISIPIHVLYLYGEENNIVMCPRNMIIAGENAQVTVLEEHTSFDPVTYFTNIVTDIHTAAGARVDYHKIQNDSADATHIAQIFINQQQDSLVQTYSLAIGAKLAREDVFVKMNARGVQSNVNGFYCLTRDNQHIDNHVHVDHIASHGTSSMVYKGVLDKKSRAVFNGKIHVHKDAQKTQSHQANHNLLLSNLAEIDTKPEFEIYADDVKCAHGSTVGQLDMDSLFYLRSRGIEKQAAMKLLTYAFAADVMNKISHAPIKQRMTILLNEKLAHDD